MAGEWLLVTQLVAAGLMVLLAAWLLRLDPRQPTVRVFVAFLLLRAGAIVVAQVPELFPSPAVSFAASATLVHIDLALLGTIATFAFLYPRRRGPAVRRWGLGLVWLVVVGAEIAYLVDHCVVVCDHADGRVEAGPLAFLASGVLLATALAGAAFAGDARVQPAGHVRVSHALIAAGFLIDAAVGSGAFTAALVAAPDLVLAAYVPSGWTWAIIAPTLAAALVVLAVALALLVAAPTLDGKGRRIARRVALATVAAAASGALVGFLVFEVGPSLRPVVSSVFGLWRIALPVLAALALARFKLFEIDLGARRVLSRTSVGAMFAGVFFVASESTATMLGTSMGTYVGIAVTGLLLFAVAPIGRAAERIVTVAVGEPSLVARMTPEERLVLYRELSERAWADAVLRRDERLFLDEVRSRLGISANDAARIETEAASATFRSPQETTP